MRTQAFALGIAATALLATGACSKQDGKSGSAPEAQTSKAQKAAGSKTIAVGLAGANGRFMAAAKAAGLDQTLAGPGPYTVFIPDDAAFAAAPTGSLDATPQNRAQLTGILTNLILPGTVLVADIDSLVDKQKDKALLATMGGGTLKVAKEGGKTVLTDSAGHKATITGGDEQYSNGVVHHIDALLMPANAGSGPSVGQKVGK